MATIAVDVLVGLHIFIAFIHSFQGVVGNVWKTLPQ